MAGESMRKGANLFGDFVKSRRMERRLTLRKFCMEVGMDPGNFSKIERGILPPPQDREKLEKWAKVLQLTENSPQMDEFFDFAAISKGRLPDYVMDDQELARALPLIFRTVRGNKISDEQFEKLKDLIREAFSGR